MTSVVQVVSAHFAYLQPTVLCISPPPCSPTLRHPARIHGTIGRNSGTHPGKYTHPGHAESYGQSIPCTCIILKRVKSWGVNLYRDVCLYHCLSSRIRLHSAVGMLACKYDMTTHFSPDIRVSIPTPCASPFSHHPVNRLPPFFRNVPIPWYRLFQKPPSYMSPLQEISLPTPVMRLWECACEIVWAWAWAWIEKGRAVSSQLDVMQHNTLEVFL